MGMLSILDQVYGIAFGSEQSYQYDVFVKNFEFTV